MKLKKLAFLLSTILLTSSINILAQENKIEPTVASTTVLEEKKEINKIPQNIEFTVNELVIDENLKNLLNQDSFAKRYILLKGLINQKGLDLVKLKTDDKEHSIPLTSYLLLEGYEEEAIRLVEEDLSSDIKNFNFNGNTYNDLIISVFNKNLKFFKLVAEKNKDRLNEQFMFNGEEGYYLFLLVAQTKSPETNDFTKILLENGASPYIQTKNGYTAEKVASFENNIYLLETLHDFENKRDKKDVLINASLPYAQKIKQQKIIENLNDGMLQDLKNKGKLHDNWITLILYGYNEAANIVFEELKKDSSFDVNKPNAKGINALMAASMSAIPGGNIEYAIKLQNEGINFNYEFNDTQAMHIAVTQDAYKIVMFLIKNKYNFIQDKKGKSFFDIAMESKSYKSAYIIKEAMKIVVENAPKK